MSFDWIIPRREYGRDPIFLDKNSIFLKNFLWYLLTVEHTISENLYFMHAMYVLAHHGSMKTSIASNTQHPKEVVGSFHRGATGKEPFNGQEEGY